MQIRRHLTVLTLISKTKVLFQLEGFQTKSAARKTLYSGRTGLTIFGGIHRSRCEADHFTSSSAEIGMSGAVRSRHPYAFMAFTGTTLPSSYHLLVRFLLLNVHTDLLSCITAI